jgi:4-hydroxyphenylpyruvate dioxygenase-like putative hemolysin
LFQKSGSFFIDGEKFVFRNILEGTMIEQCLTGLQHIGIPTNDIKATIDFYKALGFEIVKEEYLEK